MIFVVWMCDLVALTRCCKLASFISIFIFRLNILSRTAYGQDLRRCLHCAAFCCSSVHDPYDSWYVEYESKSGTQHVGKTLPHPSLFLLTERRSARSSDYWPQAHCSAWRSGRTSSPDHKDNGGTTILSVYLRRLRRLVSEMRRRYVSFYQLVEAIS